jgi:hypothetical protein
MTLVALQCGEADPVTGDVEVGGESAAAFRRTLGRFPNRSECWCFEHESGNRRISPARGSAAFGVKSIGGAGRRSFVNVLGLGGRLQKSKSGRFALG